MSNSQSIIILSAKPYKFTGDSGEVFEGFSLNFVETDSLKPFTDDDGILGYVPMRTSISSKLVGGVKTIPGVYNVVFKKKSDPDKGIVLKISELSFVRDFLSSPSKA